MMYVVTQHGKDTWDTEADQETGFLCVIVDHIVAMDPHDLRAYHERLSEASDKLASKLAILEAKYANIKPPQARPVPCPGGDARDQTAMGSGGDT